MCLAPRPRLLPSCAIFGPEGLPHFLDVVGVLLHASSEHRRVPEPLRATPVSQIESNDRSVLGEVGEILEQVEAVEDQQHGGTLACLSVEQASPVIGYDVTAVVQASIHRPRTLPAIIKK